jgi:hypothetical protein
MKRILFPIALLVFLPAFEWSEVQEKYTTDMQACQESVASRTRQEEPVNRVYNDNNASSKKVFNSDAVKKLFQTCMTRRGWNLGGSGKKGDE